MRFLWLFLLMLCGKIAVHKSSKISEVVEAVDLTEIIAGSLEEGRRINDKRILQKKSNSFRVFFVLIVLFILQWFY